MVGPGSTASPPAGAPQDRRSRGDDIEELILSAAPMNRRASLWLGAGEPRRIAGGGWREGQVRQWAPIMVGPGLPQDRPSGSLSGVRLPGV